MNNLNLSIIEAKNLQSTGTTRTGDPYCVVRVGNEKQKTRVIHNTNNPKWEHRFYFPNVSLESPLIIEIRDKNLIKKDRMMGSLTTTVGQLRNNPRNWWPINSGFGTGGSIYIEADWPNLQQGTFQQGQQGSFQSFPQGQQGTSYSGGSSFPQGQQGFQGSSFPQGTSYSGGSSFPQGTSYSGGSSFPQGQQGFQGSSFPQGTSYSGGSSFPQGQQGIQGSGNTGGYTDIDDYSSKHHHQRQEHHNN